MRVDSDKSNLVREWLSRHDFVCALDLGGQIIFPTYGLSGISADFTLVLYFAGFSTPTRLDGGQFPRRGEVIRDPDGWIYTSIFFSPITQESALLAELDATFDRMLDMSNRLPSTSDRLACLWHKAKHKVRRALAA